MTNSAPVPIDVAFDAMRVCEALAKIGYEPYTAIMDIIDNAVTAKASLISVSMSLRSGKTLKMRNSVAKYQIVDDGVGMDHDEILNAFTLGSRKNYKPNSLSKYGMGLKSAGLSLGSRISIISKKNGDFSLKHTFDIHEIERKNKLVILQQEMTSDERVLVEAAIPGDSGTFVEIDGCENVNQSSPAATIGKLKERLGVVYYTFLKSPVAPLQIQTRVSSDAAPGVYEPVVPKDLLFIEEAKKHTGWTPAEYDFVSPYLVLQQTWDSLRDKDDKPLPPITIHAVAFPQASLADDNSPLNPAERAIVKSYSVSRENSGFFIYRNGRLIRWGDGLERPNGKPLITKDDINIRIRFEIQDVHDDLLHVDVSKQRLEIDDEIVADLERIVARALKIAKEIRTVCKEKLKPKHGEGQHFSQSVRAVPEDDPQQSAAGAPSEETIARQHKKNQDAQLAIQQIEEGRNAEEGASEISGFQKVRYSEKIPYGQVWKPYLGVSEFLCKRDFV